jgi:hypothetical protein
MAQELLYTSAPRGLKSGSRGFCTVEATAGLSPALVAALEGLSGYRHVAAPGDPANPVVYSHATLAIAGRRCSVVSRVADAGADYTGRTNKLAHHLALDTAERPKGGPAWLAGRPNVLRSQFEGEPHTLPPRVIPQGDRPPAVCKAWQAATGDAGWAGVLAEAFLADPNRMAYLIVPPGFDSLPLFEEAIALLPPERRWEPTFTTWHTSLPQNVTCLWRAVPAGSKEAHESRRFVQALRIDLTQPLSPAVGGPLVEAARTGRQPAAASPRAQKGPTIQRASTAAAIAPPTAPPSPSDDTRLDVMPVGKPRRPDQFLIEPLERPPALRRPSRWKAALWVAAAVACLVVIALPVVLGVMHFSKGKPIEKQVMTAIDPAQANANTPPPVIAKQKRRRSSDAAKPAIGGVNEQPSIKQPMEGNEKDSGKSNDRSRSPKAEPMAMIGDVPGVSPSQTPERAGTPDKPPSEMPEEADMPGEPSMEVAPPPVDGLPVSGNIVPISVDVVKDRDEFRFSPKMIKDLVNPEKVALWLPRSVTEDRYLARNLAEEVDVTRGAAAIGTVSRIQGEDESLTIQFIPNSPRIGNIFAEDLAWAIVVAKEKDHTQHLCTWSWPPTTDDVPIKNDSIQLPLPYVKREAGNSSQNDNLEKLKCPPCTVSISIEIAWPNKPATRYLFTRSAKTETILTCKEFEDDVCDLLANALSYHSAPEKTEGEVDQRPAKDDNTAPTMATGLEVKQRDFISVRISPSDIWGPLKSAVNRNGIALCTPLSRFGIQQGNGSPSYNYDKIVAPRGLDHVETVANNFDGYIATVKSKLTNSQNATSNDNAVSTATELVRQLEQLAGTARDEIERVRRLAQWAKAVRNAKVVAAVATYEVFDADNNAHKVEVFRFPSLN